MKALKLMIFFGGLLIYLSIYVIVHAQTSGNGNTILELHQTTPTTIPKSQPQISQPVIQKQAPTLTQTRVSFSQPYLSFGFLIPGEPVLRTDTLQVQTTHNKGTTVFIMKDNPLQSVSALIPDTSCDNGSCSVTQASVWASPLTFGFGFRCENSAACTRDFTQENTFRPISHTVPVPVLKTTNQTETATLIYKLNIPSSQPPLPYTNNLTYFVIPNL